MADDPKVPVNLRLGRRSKQALTRIASRRKQPVSELLREILERYVAEEERRAWRAEARRAAEALAEEARQGGSSEAATLRLLDANLKAFAREWVWDSE
jgi:hypothetical protein